MATPPPQLVVVKNGFRNVPRTALFGANFQSPGNAGIAREAQCVALDITDHAAIIAFCKTNNIEFVVIGLERECIVCRVQRADRIHLAADLEHQMLLPRNILRGMR